MFIYFNNNVWGDSETFPETWHWMACPGAQVNQRSQWSPNSPLEWGSDSSCTQTCGLCRVFPGRPGFAWPVESGQQPYCLQLWELCSLAANLQFKHSCLLVHMLPCAGVLEGRLSWVSSVPTVQRASSCCSWPDLASFFHCDFVKRQPVQRLVGL